MLLHKLRDVAKLEMCQADSQLTDARPKEVKVNWVWPARLQLYFEIFRQHISQKNSDKPKIRQGDGILSGSPGSNILAHGPSDPWESDDLGSQNGKVF